MQKNLAKLLILLLKVYQLTLSRFFGQCCRFYPSCSQYALEAIARHGAYKGGRLALKRLGRCHPWHEGGEDMVPPIDNPRDEKMHTAP